MSRDFIRKLKKDIPDSKSHKNKQIAMVEIDGTVEVGGEFSLTLGKKEFSYKVDKLLSDNLCVGGKTISSSELNGRTTAKNAFNGKLQEGGWYVKCDNEPQWLSYTFNESVIVSDIVLYMTNVNSRIRHGSVEGSVDGVSWETIPLNSVTGSGELVVDGFRMYEWLSVSNNWESMKIHLNNNVGYKMIRINVNDSYTDVVGIVEMQCFSESVATTRSVLEQFKRTIGGLYDVGIIDDNKMRISSDSEFIIKTSVEDSLCVFDSRILVKSDTTSSVSIGGFMPQTKKSPHSIPVSDECGMLDDWVSYERTRVLDVVLDELSLVADFKNIKQVDVWCDGMKLSRHVHYDGEFGVIKFDNIFSGKLIEVHIRC